MILLERRHHKAPEFNCQMLSMFVEKDSRSCSREEKSQDQVASVFRVSQFMEDVEKNCAIIQAANDGYACKRGIGICKDEIRNFEVVVDAYASDVLSDGFDYPRRVCGQGIVFRMSGRDVGQEKSLP